MNYIFLLFLILVSHLSYSSEVDILSELSTSKYLYLQKEFLKRKKFLCFNKKISNIESFDKLICEKGDLKIIFTNFYRDSETTTIEIFFNKVKGKKVSIHLINQIFKINLFKTNPNLFEFSNNKNTYIYSDKESKILIIKNPPKIFY